LTSPADDDIVVAAACPAREEGKETRAHFDAVHEKFLDHVRTMGDGHAALAQRQQELADAKDALRRRVDRVEDRVAASKRRRQ
jgi:hypothetical protein